MSGSGPCNRPNTVNSQMPSTTVVVSSQGQSGQQGSTRDKQEHQGPLDHPGRLAQLGATGATGETGTSGTEGLLAQPAQPGLLAQLVLPVHRVLRQHPTKTRLQANSHHGV